jgi:putative inorganic carbon (hco3(-)) transporter
MMATLQQKRVIKWEWMILLAYACCWAIALYRGIGWLSQTLQYLAIGLPALYIVFFQKRVLIPLLVILIPLSVSSNIGGGFAMNFPSEGLTALLMILLVVRAFLHPVIHAAILKHPIVILLLIELFWMLLSSALANQPEVGFKRSLVRFSYIAVFVIILAQWFESPRKRMLLFVLYGLGAIWPIINGMLFHARFGFTPNTSYWMPKPFFNDHTMYGACLAFVIPALLIFSFNMRRLGLVRWQKIALVILTLLFLVAEFFSYSRAAWVSLVAAGLFAILIRFRVKLWMLISILALFATVFLVNQQAIIETIRRNESVSNKGDLGDHILSVANVQSDASNLERINRWNCAMRMAQEQPIFGFGPGSYQFEYGRFQIRADMTKISTFSGNRGHAHSEFFNALSETGFPGAILFLIIMFAVIGFGLNCIYRTKDQTQRLIALAALLGLITFYVHGFFNAFIDSDKMAVLIFGSIAIFVATDVYAKKNQGKQPELNH